MPDDEWFSDAALAKQSALAALPEGAPVDLRLLWGAYAPRTQPSYDERCRCCGNDAREGAGGNGRHCDICVGREHDDDD